MWVEKKTPDNCGAVKTLNSFFDKAIIRKIAKSSGFMLRAVRKISPYHFVSGFLLSVCNGQTSFQAWAIQISILSGQTVSKQGLSDRIHARATVYAQQLLQHALLQKIVTNSPRVTELFKTFRKVVLHDSTTVRLPAALAWLFPGNRSMGEQKAVARIQSIIDIKSMRFLDLILGAFTQNDQSASKTILGWVKKGDVVIRDLGYFAIDTFKNLIEKEVDFLSRLKYGVNVYDGQGKQIALKKLLRQGKVIDRWVWIGAEKQVRVRLLMIPLPPAQAARKKRKARKDRDRRLNHSKEYYQWLDFNVYITTVGKEIWSAQDVTQAYQVRWQIEIIFKSWKSSFHLEQIFREECENEHRIKVSIYLMLLFICLFMQKIYVYYKDKTEKRIGKQISLLKLSKFFTAHITNVFSMTSAQLADLISRYCCYEKRTDRINLALLYQKTKHLT